MTNHYPGPWNFFKTSTYNAVIAANGEVVCDDELYCPTDLDPCNGPIIAASPDLLTWSEALLGEIDENECGAGTCVIIGKLRSAIAKAKGETA